MDINHIKELIDLMEERSLASLEVQDGDKKVCVQRYIAPLAVTLPSNTAQNFSSTPAAAIHRGAIETSPMVGVYYAAPTPSDAPFIKIGQHVEAGDTLGIVEAMKIMNPIEATQSGTIEAILVENGDVVQFGQAIVRYKI